MSLFKHKIKSASEDFTPSMLPTTRKAMFFDVVKLHFGKFLLFGLGIFLFSIPIHAIALLEDANVMQITKIIEGATEEQALFGVRVMNRMSLIFAILKIPFLLVLGIALAGLSRVIRQYSWGENVAFVSEFIEGVKTNSPTYLILFLLGGLFNAALVYCDGLAALTDDFFAQVAANLPRVAFLILVIPPSAYASVITTIYKTNFLKLFATSFILYAKTAPKTLLALGVCLLPFVMHIIPIFLSHIIGRLICSFFVPFVFLGWYLFALNGIDKYINSEQHPELCGKGLYKP